MAYRAWLSFLAALLLWVFFDTTKHSPVFIPFAPFDNDPYDVVGSFTFQIAIAVGVLNLVRLGLAKRRESGACLLYVGRGIAVVALCIAVTMASDTFAILRSGVHPPRSRIEAILWIAMAVLALISAALIAGLHIGRPVSPSANNAPEFGWIFQRSMFCSIDPQWHAFRFALVLALSMGIVTTAAEIVSDGPAPTLRQTILVVVLRIAIEGFAVFVGVLSLGAYLGVVAFSRKRAP